MLMRLDLALMTEAAGLAEEEREDIKPLVIIYMPKGCITTSHSVTRL